MFEILQEPTLITESKAQTNVNPIRALFVNFSLAF